MGWIIYDLESVPNSAEPYPEDPIVRACYDSIRYGTPAPVFKLEPDHILMDDSQSEGKQERKKSKDTANNDKSAESRTLKKTRNKSERTGKAP